MVGTKVDAAANAVGRGFRGLQQGSSTKTARRTSRAKAKASLRTYGFLSLILPYTNAGWEKLSIFLTLLVPKLPAPVEEDLSKGILEAIDMDSYRVEKKAVVKMQTA